MLPENNAARNKRPDGILKFIVAERGKKGQRERTVIFCSSQENARYTLPSFNLREIDKE